jgi:hypothetical protein
MTFDPYTITIQSEADRDKASRALARVPAGSRVTFEGEKRSLPQNARLWPLLEFVAKNLDYHGAKLSKEDWKDLFTAAWLREKRGVRIVPNLDGDGFVMLGLRTSKMSVQEMAELQTLIEAYLAKNGLEWNDAA